MLITEVIEGTDNIHVYSTEGSILANGVELEEDTQHKDVVDSIEYKETHKAFGEATEQDYQEALAELGVEL